MPKTVMIYLTQNGVLTITTDSRTLAALQEADDLGLGKSMIPILGSFKDDPQVRRSCLWRGQSRQHDLVA